MSATKPTKLDLFREHKADYVKPKKPRRVTIAAARYLAVDGRGAPGEAEFVDKIGVLYGMAYTAKFNSKFAGRDFVVCKLETLWGAGGEAAADLSNTPKQEWPWRMLIRVPDFITGRDLDTARATLRDKGKEGDFDAVGLETLEEGECVQLLHLGPYEEEQRSIELMHEFLAAEGLRPRLWQHDIYLNDPRRVPSERLQTILRQPVSDA